MRSLPRCQLLLLLLHASAAINLSPNVLIWTIRTFKFETRLKPKEKKGFNFLRQKNINEKTKLLS